MAGLLESSAGNNKFYSKENFFSSASDTFHLLSYNQSLYKVTGVEAGYRWSSEVMDIPANRPNLIRIVPIFEFQNLKKFGHSDFQEEKKDIFFCKNLELSC